MIVYVYVRAFLITGFEMETFRRVRTHVFNIWGPFIMCWPLEMIRPGQETISLLRESIA